MVRLHLVFASQLSGLAHWVCRDEVAPPLNKEQIRNAVHRVRQSNNNVVLCVRCGSQNCTPTLICCSVRVLTHIAKTARKHNTFVHRDLNITLVHTMSTMRLELDYADAALQLLSSIRNT